ncbi:stellacyanin-like [Tasmannia lanceolata]|uniref:stellacyanin-like n=1 Tax=Tasmannia lanceolata TaxID=3420 RepID=UPI0040628435
MAKLFLYFYVLVGLSSLFLTCRATVYTVGGTGGWDISTDLGSWVAGKTFNAGDTLSFQYSSLHSVNQVNKDGFDNCSATNALLSSRDGNTSIPLSSPGQKYFICGTLSHCLGGMKLKVNVNGNQTTSPAGSPLLPPEKAPSVQLPSTKNNGPLPTVPSTGFSHTARNSLSAACFSILGAILWNELV